MKKKNVPTPPISRIDPLTTDEPFEWEHVNDDSNVVLINNKINLTIRRYDIVDENGNRLYDTISIVEPDNGCVVIVESNGCIGLVYEWRPIPNKWFWAFPRGFGELKDKSEIETAIREVREEIGKCEILSTHSLGIVHQNTTFYENPTNVILVKVEHFSEFNLQGTEGITKFSFFSTQKIMNMIQRGEITCQFTLSSLMKYFTAIKTLKK